MSEPIVNKVAESALVSIDLEQFLPRETPLVFDLKEYLFKGLILKEKEFRSALQETNWEQYRGKVVLVLCSADAIVPFWAYMLVASYLRPVTGDIYMENLQQWKTRVLLRQIEELDLSVYADKRIVIKGCGDEPVAEAAYFEITKKLQPIARSIMYGEPCSTVPIYKKK
ncbi:MAG: DUF2480 family protein [Chitinophagaceae bacterium]